MYPYDPRLKTPQELKATEFISQKVIDQIMKSIIPDKKGKLTNQSWLIYGARGMGKSHILTLIYHKTREDKKLSERWFPILCPEELFTVNSLYRLFKKFASLITMELECQDELKNCKQCISEIEDIEKIKVIGSATKRKEQELELVEKYINILIKINKMLKKKFIFFIENLQEVFSKQIDENGQKRLRDIFLQYSGLMIWIASAVQIPGKLRDYGMPFYHFFRTRKLEGMNSDEIMKMLYKFCEVYKTNKLKKNLREMKSDISVFGLLSGGNPRLIMLLYKFLENGEVKRIKEMMKIFISDLTPYFQRETETLSYQQRLIIDSLSTNLFPLLSKKDIAEDCNLPDEIVSSQVNKLKVTHWLRLEAIKALKKDLFILNEYIYRVWYQMRMGGIYQENARWVSEFLSFIFPFKKIKMKIGELENLISKENIEDKITFRSELETYKKALEWLEQKEVKKYFEFLKSPKKEVEKEIKEVLELIESNKFEKALSILNKLIKKEPKKFDYYFLRGYSNNVLKQYDKSIKDYTKAIKLNTEYASAYNNRGNSYSALKQYDKAIKDYTKAIEFNPEDASAYYNRGNSYSSLKEYNKAIKDYTNAIELNPEDAGAYYNRGNSFSDLKEHNKAIKDYTKAIELNPEDAEAYNNRGNRYSDLKEYNKAIKDYTKAIELNPEDAFTYHNRGMSYAHLKEFDNCIKDFQLLTLNIDVFPIVIKPTYDFLFKFIADNFKVSDSIQNLFNKGISIERILKHILILMHYKQNEIIKTYFSEKSWKIMESLKSPYPLVISFSALFNLIETVSSADSKYMEFASLWLNIIKHIVFENKKQKEDTFNKSLMLIYAFAIKEKKSAEMTEQVLKLINKEYHPIAELHYYIPKALIDEKDTDVQKLMKDSIFEATVEKIKDQRKNI